MTLDQRRVVIDALAANIGRLDLGRPARVAVDGITAAGKTTFADELAAAVRATGRACTRVTMDGFHQPRAVRYRQGRGSADGYYDDAYDLAALRRELLEPLGPDGDRRYRTAVIDLAEDRALDLAAEVADEQLVVVVDGSFLQKPELDGAWDLVVYLDASFSAALARGVARDEALLGSRADAERMFRERYHAAQRRYLEERAPAVRAGVRVRHDDPGAPVIEVYRGGPDPRIDDARAFFAPRAEGWNDRFAQDGPALARAVEELGVAPGATALDVGCGAGRALDLLGPRAGPSGMAVGVDVTIDMLRAARPGARQARLLAADGAQLPLRATSVDAIFAAGYLSHLANPVLGLVELARVARDGARLALFHPVGRAALAAKHGRELAADDVLEPANLPVVLAAAGWASASIDDGPDRYLALATRSR